MVDIYHALKIVYDICTGKGGLDNGSSDTWYRCRREQDEDGRWCDKVPVSAL